MCHTYTVTEGLFISYRRSDSQSATGRLADHLRQKGFDGEDDMFFDIDHRIPPGVDFRVVINDTLARCDLVIVVIGRHWLDASDSEGRRRLDRPSDTHRLEVAAALDSDARVIPVLVEGASHPSEEDLPDDLKILAFLQSWVLGERNYVSDVETLAERLLDARRQMEAEREGAAPEQPAAESLSNLAALRESGVITEDELHAQKEKAAQLLAETDAPNAPIVAHRQQPSGDQAKAKRRLVVLAGIILAVAGFAIALWALNRDTAATVTIPDLEALYVEMISNTNPTEYWPLVISGTVVPVAGAEPSSDRLEISGPGTLNALRFDGSADDRLETGLNPASELEGDWSIEAWIRTSSKENLAVIGGFSNVQGTADDRRWYVAVQEGRMCSGVGSSDQQCAGPSVADNRWHLLVAVFDAEVGEVSMFVDGAEILSYQPSSVLLVDHEVAIGSMWDVEEEEWQEHWSGSLSHVAIHGRAFGADEVALHHAAGAATE
jgi:hypothetical protein